MPAEILGIRVDATSYDDAAGQILEWTRSSQGRYVCLANVHMLMEARDDPEFRKIVDAADLVAPDGMPLVWMLRSKGRRSQPRVYGPTLMLRLVESAARLGVKIGLYGSMPGVLEALKLRLARTNPGLDLAFSHSPPIGDSTPDEDARICSEILASGVRLLFVGLGCPRQEKWMAAHRDKLPLVMLGVGAAFDFHAGAKPQAPRWMQSLGLEWFFRLIHEPFRLWRRYLVHNPRFALLALAELIGARRARC
jgi:N-acetylglucosaminyldiphosphoundecaprenol N-acetyl-beta-D-mannosaminyltransferase